MAKPQWAIEDKDFRKAIADLMAAQGADAATQRDYVVGMCLLKGDTGPYIEAVLRDDMPGPFVQTIIAAMMLAPAHYPYHLKIKRREGLRGRPETTAGVWRDAVVWLMFKTACDKGLKAEEALEAIHDELGMSVGSVKAAVRRLNKTATAPPINS